MLLAADVGNTEIVLGVFDGADLRHTWRSSTRPERTSDELALLLSGFLEHRDLDLRSDITGLCLASVVPDVTGQFREMAASYLTHEPLVVGPGMKTGVSVLTDNPREVGADRVVNTLAAFTMFGGPAIVVDFGTGTNFDVVSDKGEFLGGVIAPGLEIAAEALFSRAAKLPRIELAAPARVIGKATVDSMQAGLVYGYVGLVEGVTKRVLDEIGGGPVVATGGLGRVIAQHTSLFKAVDDDLTLKGLKLLWERNRPER